MVRLPAAMGKGHVVLAHAIGTDFAVAARIAAALLGCFLTTPQVFCQDAPRGIMYGEAYKNDKHRFHVAVTASMGNDLPTLPQLLRAVAGAPGSTCKFYVSERKLCKVYKRVSRTTPRLQQRMCVLATQADHDAADKKYRELFLTPARFLLRFDASNRTVCPGCGPAGGRTYG